MKYKLRYLIDPFPRVKQFPLVPNSCGSASRKWCSDPVIHLLWAISEMLFRLSTASGDSDGVREAPSSTRRMICS